MDFREEIFFVNRSVKFRFLSLLGVLRAVRNICIWINCSFNDILYIDGKFRLTNGIQIWKLFDLNNFAVNKRYQTFEIELILYRIDFILNININFRV